jgi:hypothetical protein
VLKFFYRLKKTASEANNLLKEAYGEEVLTQSRALQLFKQFKEGRQLFEKLGGLTTVQYLQSSWTT